MVDVLATAGTVRLAVFDGPRDVSCSINEVGADDGVDKHEKKKNQSEMFTPLLLLMLSPRFRLFFFDSRSLPLALDFLR